MIQLQLQQCHQAKDWKYQFQCLHMLFLMYVDTRSYQILSTATPESVCHQLDIHKQFKAHVFLVSSHTLDSSKAFCTYAQTGRSLVTKSINTLTKQEPHKFETNTNCASGPSLSSSFQRGLTHETHAGDDHNEGSNDYRSHPHPKDYHILLLTWVHHKII